MTPSRPNTSDRRIAGYPVPLAVIAPTYQHVVFWAKRAGFTPLDMRRGDLVPLTWGAGGGVESAQRLRGSRLAAYIILDLWELTSDFWAARWLMKMMHVIVPTGAVEVGNWTGALDGAVREALFQLYFPGRPPNLGAFFQDGP